MTPNIAIVGGGPGGLMAAYLLEQKYPDSCRMTLFEATGRIGGKIQTRRFSSFPVPYEGGVAECYDYREIGPDPLRALVESLGLETKPLSGKTVLFDGQILRNEEELAVREAVERFRRRAAELLPTDRWCRADWKEDNAHPWAARSCEELLDEVSDPIARKFLRVTAHTDLATEPHRTSGLNGLKNFLMDVSGYVRQYSIVGGMERLPLALARELRATRIELGAEVRSVARTGSERYLVRFDRGRTPEAREFDAVVVALPHNWLGAVAWEGARLERAMADHIAHYDHPGHYLRVSVLFDRPFWRDRIDGSWFMLDAFGGTCVYDESARHDCLGLGALGFLLAGTPAATLANLDDDDLVRRVLESLPKELYALASGGLLEAKVHRWTGAVSGLPGGFPRHDPRSAHVPEPVEHPGLVVVGDYLFDGTLNGVYESADLATDLLRARASRSPSTQKEPCALGQR